MTDIIRKLKNIVTSYHNNIEALKTEAANFQRDYANVYLPDVFTSKLSEITAKKDAAIRDGNTAIKAAVDAFLDEIKDIDALDGTRLNEGDMKLLESGIALSQNDLEIMFDHARADKNRTMQQIILRRSQRDGITICRLYYTTAEIVEGVRLMENYAVSALTSDTYFNMIWSDERINRVIPAPLLDLYNLEPRYRYEG